LGVQFKHHLESLKKTNGGWRSEVTTIAVLPKPVPTVLVDIAHMEESDDDLAAMAAQYEILTTTMAQTCPEIVETMATGIVNQETFQLDCKSLWAEVFGLEVTITGVNAAVNIPEFEHHIQVQYRTHIEGTMGLPPARKDVGFQIRMISEVECPHLLPH
jgi:hypothetical protein